MEKDEHGSSRKVDKPRQPKGLYDMRSQSAYFSHTSSSLPKPKEKKTTSTRSSGGSVSARFGGWNCMNDPEMQRKKRVAEYSSYSVESKVKGSFGKSFRWIKDRYNQVVYGFK